MRRAGVYAFFKTCRRIRANAQPAACAAYVFSVKFGSFQQHCGRIGFYTRIESAHHPGKSHGARFVRYNKYVFVKLVLLFIQRNNGFPFPCAAHNNGFVRYFLVVERVHGLTYFKQDVVGHVNYIVYTAQARSMEASAHPQGRRFYFDFRRLHEVSGAKLGVTNIHVYVLPRRYFINGVEIRFGRREFSFQCYCRLSCNTDDAVAVGTVECDGNVYNALVQSDDFLYVPAYFGILFENKNSVHRRACILILANSQFFAAAHHSV